MAKSLVCWNCGESLSDVPLPLSRHANCRACFEVLRCCRMCRHYAPNKRPYCDHERADPPVEKETANFCDYFRPANRFSVKDASQSEKAKSELDDLFGGGDHEPQDEPSQDNLNDLESRNRFNDLFDD